VTGGHDLRHFVRGMMRAVRNVLVVRAVGFDEELVDAMEADRATIEAMARELLEPELVRMFAALAALEQEIRLSSDPRFQLELGMVRLAEFPRLRPLDDVLERLERLESRLGIAAATGSKPALPPASSPSSIRGAIASAPASGATVAPTSVETGPGPGSGSLKAQLVAALENAGKGLAAVTIEEAVAVTLEGSKLAIRYSRGTHAIRRFDDPAFRDGVTAVAGELFHTPVQMEVSVADEAALANAVVPPATPPVAPACDDPMVQTVIEVFRGRLEELRPPETDKTT
jgi:DNA polymerase III gamma/tau subunit